MPQKYLVMIDLTDMALLSEKFKLGTKKIKRHHGSYKSFVIN